MFHPLLLTNQNMKQPTHRALTLAMTFALSLATLGLTACDKPGPAQEAGRHIDEAAEEASSTAEHKLDKAKTLTKEYLKQVEAALSDADITVKVELALMKRDGLNSSNISVKTLERVVTLTGSVSDAAQSRLATDLARAVDDVKRVENYLSIVSSPQ